MFKNNIVWKTNSLHPRDATTTTDLNVVTSEASAANSLHPRDATTTTDLNVVTSEASAVNSLIFVCAAGCSAARLGRFDSPLNPGNVGNN